MKRLLTLCTVLCFAIVAMAQSEQPLPKMFAHRGCWSKICPENSIPAVGRAARHGYMGIECDVKLTKDGKMVLMHDKTINRTCRNADDYSKIQGKVKIEDLTFRELRNNYVLESPNRDYRMPVPTLEELNASLKSPAAVFVISSGEPKRTSVVNGVPFWARVTS